MRETGCFHGSDVLPAFHSADRFVTVEGKVMTRRFLRLVVGSALLFSGVVNAQQFPMLDEVAGKIVQKYQNSTCEQLWQEKSQKQGQPKSPSEQRAVQLLRTDPQMRAEFINRVAAPIANKMFECGMIP
jgi:hypothetical protein